MRRGKEGGQQAAGKSIDQREAREQAEECGGVRMVSPTQVGMGNSPATVGKYCGNQGLIDQKLWGPGCRVKRPCEKEERDARKK